MKLNRRRFLMLTSAACLAKPAISNDLYRWRGIALGAEAQILLDHPDAKNITKRAHAEINRLENIFSLYREDSELARLNQAGALKAPSFELIECLSTARYVHQVTEGLFDPSVQPLWAALAEGYMSDVGLDEVRIAKAKAAIGFDRIEFDSSRIQMDAGQALTLNGIAQGYIADRIAKQMRQDGIIDVLIDTGEIIAAGNQAWPVKIQGEVEPRLWQNRALATSAMLGTVLNTNQKQGHILNPKGDQSASKISQITISAPHAALADGLSTGLSLLKNRSQAEVVLEKVPEVGIESIVTSLI